ncbi:MAG: sigma-70 family RNA polymerase sigma factor [Cyanobacteria bacterium J06635_1]
MEIPNFPECDHTLVQSLFQHSDYDLVRLLQQHPESGRYFTTIFCRYSPVVYSLIRHSARSPVQSEYLFALTWRHILHELMGIDLPAEGDKAAFALQGWLINLTAACINQTDVPEVESIHYSLKETSPPFWCYVSQALDQLQPVQRLMVVMAQTFHWSETRIAAYLQAEGQPISPKLVQSQLTVAYQALEMALPDDVRAIYLEVMPAQDSEPSELDELLDMSDLDFSPTTLNPSGE